MRNSDSGISACRADMDFGDAADLIEDFAQALAACKGSGAA